MQEKMCKYLKTVLCQAAAAAGVLLFLFAAKHFAPGIVEKISPVWEKSTDLTKLGKLFKEIISELFPF